MFDFKFKKISWKIYLSIFVLLMLMGALVYINSKFGASKIEVEFFETEGLSAENLEIKKYIEREVGKNADTLLNLFLLDNSLITKLVRDEYELVNRIDIDKKPYFNNSQDFGLKLYAVVIKNDEYFYACVEDKSKENFLVWSMLGNSDGEFYKEIPQEDCESKSQKLIKFTVNPKALFSKFDQEKVSGADSLSGMRVYRSKDFAVLKEIVSYLQKNSFEIKDVYVNELKLVDIDLGDYVLRVNLDKDSNLTIDDFETVSRAGKLQKYINDDKDAIDYVDLTYKNKVFFKLKNGSLNFENDTNTDIMSTTTEMH